MNIFLKANAKKVEFYLLEGVLTLIEISSLTMWVKTKRAQSNI